VLGRESGRVRSVQRSFRSRLDGLRSYLLEKGIDIRFGYVSERPLMSKGEIKELWRYADQWTFQHDARSSKLLGLNQAQFRITITDRNGRNSVPMPILVP